MSREHSSSYALDHIIWDRSSVYSEAGEIQELGESGFALDEEYSHPDITGSAELAAEAMQEAGYHTDFSLESLAEMDRCFAEKVNSETPGYRDFFAEDLSGRSFTMGAYLGEVIRQSVGGEWVGESEDPMIHVNLQLELPDGSICRPMKQVLTRLNRGPEVSFVKWAQQFGVAEGLSGAACEVKVSSADFPIRGYVTVWHYPDSEEKGYYNFAADATACVNLLAYLSYLESHNVPSIKSINTLIEEEGVAVPELEGLPGKILQQLVLFYDGEQDADHWKFNEVPEGLYLEFSTNGLNSLKQGINQMFLGQETPIIGTNDVYLQIWSKAKLTEDADPGEDASNASE